MADKDKVETKPENKMETLLQELIASNQTVAAEIVKTRQLLELIIEGIG